MKLKLSILCFLSCLGVGIRAQTLLKDIGRSFINTTPSYLCKTENGFFFLANDSLHGQELWFSDGTESGTHLVNDYSPGTNNTFYRGISASVNDHLFILTPPNQFNQSNLLISDGTGSGTQILNRQFPDEWTNVNVQDKVVWFKNRYFLIGFDSARGSELWTSDGTAANTKFFKDLDTVALKSSQINNMIVIGDYLYFIATTSSEGTELWVSDGTVAGTKILSTQNPGPTSSLPINNQTLNFKSHLLYIGYLKDQVKIHLLSYDPLTQSTQTLYHPDSFKTNQSVVFVKVIDSNLLAFNTLDSIVYHAWISDGTQTGTYQLKSDEEAGSTLFIRTGSKIGNHYILYIYTNKFGYELRKLGDDRLHFSLLKDIFSGSNGSLYSDLFFKNDHLYFMANSASLGTDVWVTDGSIDGTQVFYEFNSQNFQNILNLFEFKDEFYFIGQLDQAIGFEVYKFDQINSGIRQTRKNIAKVYPNPVLAGHPITWSLQGTCTVQLYDLQGRLIREALVDSEFEIPAGLTAGTYMIRIEKDNSVDCIKLFVE